MPVDVSKAVEFHCDMANAVTGVSVAQTTLFLLAMADEKKMAAFRKFDIWIAWALVAAATGCCALIAGCHWAMGELIRGDGAAFERVSLPTPIARMVVLFAYAVGSAAFLMIVSRSAPCIGARA